MSITQIYEQTIKALPVTERYQLATLILTDIPPEARMDYSTEWSEEDMRNFTAFSLRHAAASYPEEEDIV